MLTVNQLSTITKELILNLPPNNTSQEAMAAREVRALELAEMREQRIVPDLIYDFFSDDDDPLPVATAPAAAKKPIRLAVESLTIPKIQAVLTADERLWLCRMIEVHGEEAILRLWPSYEVQINFARSL